ncbi:uncharacterized protein MEPE_06047 [Melanopsichium pennsylvanicum]|uniref:PPM-type phosphatase domain-containing protein n=2 Tax=Melanopsichium pennsylvanicum TaxID=63383 RepID=A0AAJ4XS15_9BASI|nr:chitin synthase hyaluronan synthase [Melanopsichium pennsylvanicum 4]SNX87337.1 uncharacterized protein MEPE_06047 [Melanopsichium pennsylvanicum]
MSKFPNHGLFTRTAAASNRSSSLIAQARRGAPRRRSPAIISIANPQATQNNSTNATAGPSYVSGQPSSSQRSFIGPLTLAASQNTSTQHPSSNSAFADLRTEPSAVCASNHSNLASEPRGSHEPYLDTIFGLARSSESQMRTSPQFLDSDFAITTHSALADVPAVQLTQANLLTAASTSSAAISAAARQLARLPTSPFCHPSFDHIPAHRSSQLYIIPQARGIHIFYPNSATSQALHPASSSSLNTSHAAVGFDGRSLTPRRHPQRSKNVAQSSADYLPLWTASTTSASASYSSDSLDQRLDDLSVLPTDASTSGFLGFPHNVPIDLLAGSHASVSSDYAFIRTSEESPFASIFTDRTGTASWQESDGSSSAWHSSTTSSKISKSSSSSSSSSSSRSPTPTISARPHLATSTAKKDSSGSHSSGSSTPTQNNSLSPYQIENALLGPSSLLATAAHAVHGNYDQRRSAAAASAEPSDVEKSSALWTGSFASPKHRRLHFIFEHGAYGIPKRHPWAAVRGNGKRVQSASKPVARSGAVGMLAAAADFLTGSTSMSEPPAPKGKLGGEAQVAEDGRMLGLNSPIREHGRIVRDRLQSVQVGEDAYFLRPDSIGVADGVGGWASRAGADPALFSRLLMHFCAAELSRFDGLGADHLAADGGKKLREWQQLDPVEVMHTAWERCVRASRREGILGSSTALLAVLRGDELRIANLGDCVLLIIRAGELLFRSTEQQHSFNFPVQLGMMGHTAESVTIAANRTLSRDGFLQSGASDDLDDNAPNPLGTTTTASMNEARKGQQNASDGDDAEEAEWDEPRRDAGRWSVKVQKGDIIIVGSDGLVDNLFDEDIVEEVLKFAPPAASHPSAPEDPDVSLESGGREMEEDEYRLPDDFCPQLVSEALCSRAKAVSEDSRAVSSPFQQRAMEEGLHYVGGKHDDISVVVAVVGDPSERLTRAGYSMYSEHGDASGPLHSTDQQLASASA